MVVLLALCALEDACRCGNLSRVTSLCSKVERIYKCHLSVCENSRDSALTSSAQSQMLSIPAYILNALFNLVFSNFDEEVRAELRKTICNSVIFLLSLVDFLNTRTGGNFLTHTSRKRRLSVERRSTITAENSTSNDTQEGQLTLLTFDLVRDYISANLPEPIMTIPEIRQQKTSNFSNMEAAIFSRSWMDAIVDNPALNQLIDNHFGESFVKINNKIFVTVQNLASKLDAGCQNALRRRTEVAHRCENNIYENAAKIHELEDTRRKQLTVIYQEKVRAFKGLWRRNWKRLRTYNGQWSHPDFYDQRDELYNALEWDEMKENTIFRHRISKFETKSRARPFLKIKLIEPAYVVEYQNMLKELRPLKPISEITTDLYPILAAKNIYPLPERSAGAFPDKDESKSAGFTLFGKTLFGKVTISCLVLC